MGLIRVKAVRAGWYGLTPRDHKLRVPGDVFEIEEEHFSDAHRSTAGGSKRPGWMERLDAPEPLVSVGAYSESEPKRGPGRPRKES